MLSLSFLEKASLSIVSDNPSSVTELFELEAQSSLSRSPSHRGDKITHLAEPEERSSTLHFSGRDFLLYTFMAANDSRSPIYTRLYTLLLLYPLLPMGLNFKHMYGVGFNSEF